MINYSLQKELDKERADGGGYNESDYIQINLAERNRVDTKIPEVGDKAPGFELPDEHGKQIALQSFLDKGPVVLSFFRGGWCNYCQIEIKALQRFTEEFGKFSASLVGISPTSITVQEFTRGEITITYSILSDFGNKVAKMYGLSYQMSDELNSIMAGFGLDTEAFNGLPGKEGQFLSIPGTFVISRYGEIVYAYWDYDHTKRSEPTEIIASLMSIT